MVVSKPGLRRNCPALSYCLLLYKLGYAAMLEHAAFGTGAQAGRRIYSGRLCQLVACEDHELELSEMFASCLVKRLPAGKMAPVLRGA